MNSVGAYYSPSALQPITPAAVGAYFAPNTLQAISPPISQPLVRTGAGAVPVATGRTIAMAVGLVAVVIFFATTRKARR